MANVLLLIGGNVGDVRNAIHSTHLAIQKQIGYIVEKSSLYESEPWGFDDAQNFINQVVEVKTDLEPMQLLIVAKNIEKEMGRKPKQSDGYESRVMDIDILFYNDEVVDLPHLTIPHLHIASRKFTLLPLVEKWAEMIHPTSKISLRQILSECNDNGVVAKLVE